MADRDKPKTHFSYSQFEDVELEPFVYVNKDNKRVVFPDPYGDEMDPDEAEKLLTNGQRGTYSTREMIEKWLPKADREAFLADKLNLSRRVQILEQAIGHYEKYYGDPGEGSASAS